MRKQILQMAVVLLVVLSSCKVAMQDISLEKHGLTITVPKSESKTPEYTNLKFSDDDKDFSRYDFYIDNARVNVIEIAESIYPTAIDMLKKATSGSENYVSLIETKKLANGAFGIIYNMKGSSGKEIKNYLFYFKKGSRYFRMEPVFNSELKQLDLQLAAYESLK